MRRLTVIGWALGAGLVAMFVGLLGAERLRWHIPFWYDGEVIRGAGFWLAVVTAPAAGFLVDRLHARSGKALRIALLGVGLGLLAAVLGLFVAIVF
jgi:hypothetical protein